MIRIPSGVTDQHVYFVATLAGTAVTGLSGFTVYRTRNGAAAAAMTTPTVNEVDATNMPGLYELLLDEDMTIGSGNDSEHMVFYATASGMDGAFVEIELYRPKITAGETLSPSQLVDDIWDEVITGVAHNVNNSAAKFLRESAEAITGPTGTAQSATATTLVLESGAISNDDIFNRERVTIIEGTGSGQSRLITDSVAATDTVTVKNSWVVTPDATSVYAIMGAESDVEAMAGQDVTATAQIDFDDLAAILTGTGTTIPATLATIAAYIDTEVAAIKAVTDLLPDAGALSSLATAANLATVDTVVDAIKAKTDSLTYTVAGQVDANVQSINDVTITGNGQTGTEFGV